METCSMRFSLDSQTMDWIIAAAMDKKLHYTLRDLEAAGPLRGMGVKRMGTCPRCGHDHLSIDTEKRLFHCFYAGCGHSGRIYDGDSTADTGAIVPLAGCGPVRGTTPTTVVRDQDLCSTGSVLYRRQPCGRYDERPDIESLAAEAGGAFMPKDSEPWLPLTAKE